MTSNVVAWIRAAEDERSNRAREKETNRANLVSEAHARDVLQHERNVLQHSRNVLAENARHNRATEAEASRSNRARESEATRSARANERLQSERNVLQARETQLQSRKALQESADRRYQANLSYTLGQRELSHTQWRGQQDIALNQARLRQEVFLQQRQLESNERLKTQEIAQRATQAWLNYQLGQQELDTRYNLKLLEIGGDIANDLLRSKTSATKKPNQLLK